MFSLKLTIESVDLTRWGAMIKMDSQHSSMIISCQNAIFIDDLEDTISVRCQTDKNWASHCDNFVDL